MMQSALRPFNDGTIFARAKDSTTGQEINSLPFDRRCTTFTMHRDFSLSVSVCVRRTLSSCGNYHPSLVKRIGGRKMSR